VFALRNAVAGTKMVEKWSEGDTVGIAREGKGFFAMTKRSGIMLLIFRCKV
jgi:hypothetical protein